MPKMKKASSLVSARRMPAPVAEREDQSAAGRKKAKKADGKAKINVDAQMVIGR